MAFNLNKLKEIKPESDVKYINSLKSILDSENFEDKLQEELETELKQGNDTGYIGLSYSIIDNKKTLYLSSKQRKIFYVIFDDDIETLVPSLVPYIEAIENKLKSLRLNIKYGFDIEDATFKNIDMKNNQLFKQQFVFLIDLHF